VAICQIYVAFSLSFFFPFGAPCSRRDVGHGLKTKNSLWCFALDFSVPRNAQKFNKTKHKEVSFLSFKYLLSHTLQRPLPWSVCVLLLLLLFTSKGRAPFRGGGSAAARQRAPLARMHSKLHHLPTTPCLYLASPQSSGVHVPLCGCMTLCPLRKSPRFQSDPTPCRCALPVARCLRLRGRCAAVALLLLAL
jgi:hypothetical protein